LVRILSFCKDTRGPAHALERNSQRGDVPDAPRTDESRKRRFEQEVTEATEKKPKPRM
jgi:hypothetical protein